MGRVLIAEDETGLRRFLADALEHDGHDVVAVGDGEAALAALREGGFDVLLTDLRMPRQDGMTVVRAARTEQPDVEVIVLTAFGEVLSSVRAGRAARERSARGCATQQGWTAVFRDSRTRLA